VHFIDCIELICRASGHQVGNTRSSAATKTDRNASLPSLSVKLKLPRCVVKAAKINVVHPSFDCRARYVQTKVIVVQLAITSKPRSSAVRAASSLASA